MNLEPKSLIGMRAFPESQALWAAEPYRTLDGEHTVNWYGADLRPEEPAFCLVSDTASDELQGLLGDIVAISRGDSTIYVYCLGTEALPGELAVPRRAFIGLGRLTEQDILCTVAIT